jgi:hypothetical protein
MKELMNPKARYLLPDRDVEVVALKNPQNCEAQLPEVKKQSS